VSSAGCRFTRGPAVNTTNHLSRKEPTDQGRFHSVGAEASCTSHRAFSTVLQFVCICYFSGFSTGSFYFYCKEVNILYCMVFSCQFDGYFIHGTVLKSELFVVKICIICAPSAR